MNFNKIIFDAFKENMTQQTPYLSYFVREAKINKRDNFVEYDDFFQGCNAALDRCCIHIDAQYQAAIREQRQFINLLKTGQVTNCKTPDDIEVSVNLIKEQIQGIMNMGLNRNYRCHFSETGEIIEGFYFESNALVHDDVMQMVSAIIEAVQKLSKQNDTSGVPNDGNGYGENNINQPLPVKSFVDYLIPKDNQSLIDILMKILCGKKGKVVACVILALKHLELIAFTDGEKKSLYNSMRVVFGDIGKDCGINKYLNVYGKDDKDITKLLKRSDIEPYINQLKDFKVV